VERSLASGVNVARPQSNFWSRLRQMQFRDRRIDWVGYGFVAPFVLLFFVLRVIPIFFGIYVSFTNWTVTRPPRWVGLANYQRLIEDEWVIRVWTNTLKMSALIVPGVVIVALLLAIYVNRGLFMAGLVRTSFFAPHVVAVTVTALIWVWILEKETGILNNILASIGLPKQGWLTTAQWVIPALSVVIIWQAVGFHMVILLAGLQEIPVDIREAALVDGANARQVFWSITLPLLRPALILVITLEIIAALRIFGQVFLMTDGGPAGRSATIVSYIYSTGFGGRFMLGYAATLSLLLFATIMLFTLIRMRFYRELEY
jgi:multiple sugar transport system permease protein